MNWLNRKPTAKKPKYVASFNCTIEREPTPYFHEVGGGLEGSHTLDYLSDNLSKLEEFLEGRHESYVVTVDHDFVGMRATDLGFVVSVLCHLTNGGNDLETVAVICTNEMVSVVS